MTKQIKVDMNAKEGMMIRYSGQNYKLTAEQVPRGCRGCANYFNQGCPIEVTRLCRQGYILEKVK